MIHAGIKEIKNNFSRYISQVKAGEQILVTERGKPVARIIKENTKIMSIRSALAPLEEKGLVQLPSSNLRKKELLTISAGGKSLSEMVIEDRR